VERSWISQGLGLLVGSRSSLKVEAEGSTKPSLTSLNLKTDPGAGAEPRNQWTNLISLIDQFKERVKNA